MKHLTTKQFNIKFNQWNNGEITDKQMVDILFNELAVQSKVVKKLRKEIREMHRLDDIIEDRRKDYD